MKTKVLLVVLGIMLMFSGCGQKNSDEISDSPKEYAGIVTTSGGNPYFFELETYDGNYGFVINDETKLIWQDTTAIDIFKPQSREDEFNVFGCDMYVNVKADDEAECANEYVEVEKWYVAEEITVTGINESYFAVDEKPVICSVLILLITTDGM